MRSVRAIGPGQKVPAGDLTIARDKVAGVFLGILAMGFVFDRFGTKIGYTVSIAAWSVAAIGCGAFNF